MSKQVHFIADYDHRWPSGAETAFKAGWQGSVKDEVAEAARAAGVLADAQVDQAESDGLPRNMPRLRAIAKGRKIPLGGAKTVDEILAVIRAAKPALPGEPKTE